jgi:DNA modification methylase
MDKLTIKYTNIDDLIPYDKNPRINTDAIVKVVESIKEFGFKNPVIIDETNTIIAGHTRILAAKKLGLTKIPTIQVKDLTPDQVKAFRIADNRTTEFSKWDDRLLGAELADLIAAGYDATLTGFNLKNIADLNADNAETTEDVNFDPTPPKIPVAQIGDIWQLGKHKLMCGDATDPEQVKKLMAGALMDLIITDPPYNTDYAGKTKPKIQNDEMDDGVFYKFLYSAYTNLLNSLKKGGPIYVFHADLEGINFRKAFKMAGFYLSQCLVWVKNSMVLGTSDYQGKHEPILYGWREGVAHIWHGDFDKTTVIEDKININGLTKAEMKALLQELTADKEETTILHADRPSRSADHPNMKPVKLLARLMRNSSKPGDTVGDLFGGSGSLLIAAEQIDRTCYMMEIDPRYIDVVVNRYIAYKGANDDIFLTRNHSVVPFNEICLQ